MNIAIVHNAYGKLSGEETVIENLAALLVERDVSVCRFSRSSAEIEDKLSGKMAAFFSGIHNLFAAKAFAEFLKSNRPDVVHIHNLYPLISPSILPVCTKLGIPVVMTVHNFRLACPNGLLLSHGEICHRCLGGREYWCVLRNCESSIFKSTGYALRTAAARMLRRYYDNVDHFICLSEFQKNILVGEGLPAERVSVLANPVSFDMKIPPTPLYKRGEIASAVKMDTPAFAGLRRQVHEGMTKGYVAYVGRISQEKDIFTLLEAARRLGDIPFKFAGD
ncbi:MAG TPA: glycosyltransferase, partial [Smithellaceae bacterium]|nr:glycosyltransferase [Smithellaceae bacterium]